MEVELISRESAGGESTLNRFNRGDAAGIRLGEFDHALAHSRHLRECFREDRRDDIAAKSRLQRDHPMFAVELEANGVAGQTEAQPRGEPRTPIASAFAGGEQKAPGFAITDDACEGAEPQRRGNNCFKASAVSMTMRSAP